MRTFRPRLAAVAVAVSLLQTLSLLATPLAACCGQAPAATVAHCCRPGASGMCPLHAQHRATGDGAACRLVCGSKNQTQFVLGPIGVLPPSVAIAAGLGSQTFDLSAIDLIPAISSVPDPPPPRA